MIVGAAPLLKLAAAYNGALVATPLATNCVSAACLAVVSDSIAQSLSPEPWNRERSAWMILWGAVVSGLTIFYWLMWLTSLFPDARTSLTQLFGKVAVNQIVMSPGCNGGFFAFVIWTRTKPRLIMTKAKQSALMAKYRADLLPTCLRSTAFWSVVQGINFRLLPARFGVLFTSFGFVIWTTYLSLIGNRVAKKEA